MAAEVEILLTAVDGAADTEVATGSSVEPQVSHQFTARSLRGMDRGWAELSFSPEVPHWR